LTEERRKKSGEGGGHPLVKIVGEKKRIAETERFAKKGNRGECRRMATVLMGRREEEEEPPEDYKVAGRVIHST